MGGGVKPKDTREAGAQMGSHSETMGGRRGGGPPGAPLASRSPVGDSATAATGAGEGGAAAGSRASPPHCGSAERRAGRNAGKRKHRKSQGIGGGCFGPPFPRHLPPGGQLPREGRRRRLGGGVQGGWSGWRWFFAPPTPPGAWLGPRSKSGGQVCMLRISRGHSQNRQKLFKCGTTNFRRAKFS